MEGITNFPLIIDDAHFDCDHKNTVVALVEHMLYVKRMKKSVIQLPDNTPASSLLSSSGG
jgi:hypothetical protein